jgi:hypothetical protein
MIITTFTFERNEPNKNNIYIWNERLFNFMACNVTIHKECAHGFIIFKVYNDGLIY